MNKTVERFRAWALASMEPYKLAVLTELDPRNPDKRRFLCAWGLLICGGLFFLIGAAFLLMLHSKE